MNSTFESNSILGYAQVIYFDTLNGVLTKCVIENDVIMDLVGIVFNWTHSGSYLSKSKSTFVYDLDFNAYWLGAVVTVPAWYRYVGIFTILNGSALTPVDSLDYIANVTGQYPTHPVSFQPINLTTVPFGNTSIAVAVANNICGNNLAIQNVKGRTNGTDSVEYVRSGNVWVQTQSIIIN